MMAGSLLGDEFKVLLYIVVQKYSLNTGLFQAMFFLRQSWCLMVNDDCSRLSRLYKEAVWKMR